MPFQKQVCYCRYRRRGGGGGGRRGAGGVGGKGGIVFTAKSFLQVLRLQRKQDAVCLFFVLFCFQK